MVALYLLLDCWDTLTPSAMSYINTVIVVLTALTASIQFVNLRVSQSANKMKVQKSDILVPSFFLMLERSLHKNPHEIFYIHVS